MFKTRQFTPLWEILPIQTGVVWSWLADEGPQNGAGQSVPAFDDVTRQRPQRFCVVTKPFQCDQRLVCLLYTSDAADD